ncbi:MAG: tetratricopeptide repeat protein, partial [Clostridia bacterium]|nr:tetratricopeptide repeat protein [Clostridia bacterium]
MSEINKKVPDVRPIPDNLPEELLPLYDWWKANGKTTIITAAVALVLAVTVYSIKLFCDSKVSRANQSLLQANTLEELEQAVAKDGGTKAGNATRIRLGKAYYDAGRYEDALNAYKTCLSKGAPKGFREIVEMGIAVSLEGLGKNDEALAAYQAFEKNHAGHFLLPDADFVFLHAQRL